MNIAEIGRSPALQGLGDDLPAKSGLEEFEFFQGDARDAAVAGMFDFTMGAERGADDAVMIGAVGLDFEVEIGGGWHTGI